ncbi:arylsulfatase [Mycolicibacterium conceptionense]|uniref:Arylsulfatase n=1 Tax=Mycolicibacterium conceptionense TaxID=451644 RepID=A0A0U1D2R2_9MYCO|nr:arylsulfatase [Mycolicibacterium conceptionense]
MWFSEADKYNGLPLADLNIFETMTRWRPYLVGERTRYTYYPHTAEVGLGAAAELRGQSFTVLAEVTVDGADAHGVLFKQGGAHGGHVLFIADGRLHYVYNFLGEHEQALVSPDPVPLGRHLFGVQYRRTGTVEGSHTPLGDTALYIDDTAVAELAGMRTHPGMFALAGGGICIGRNTGSAVSQRYRTPFAFTGGAIGQVTVDLSGEPYQDLERELAAAFAKD